MADAPKLKDYLTLEVVEAIAERIVSALRSLDARQLDSTAFVSAVMTPVDAAPFVDLEFTARTARIAEALHDTWQLDGAEALQALTAALPDELEQVDGVLNDGFWMWPFGDYIATYGGDDVDAVLDACYELTKRFTAEFAIRPLLDDHPDVLDRLAGWVDDPSEHVRRLVSEGTRSRLPWARRLNLPVEPVIGLLTSLKNDESLYVRRSVANHLNDLIKDHPDQIFDLFEDWSATATEETWWIIRHALRNQLKDGHPRALALFGYVTPQVEVAELVVSPSSVAIGNSVEAVFALTSTGRTEQKLMVDLVMGYMKANGSTSPKVFKYRELDLAVGSEESCAKRFDMVVRSTRKLYPGTHTLTVRVNGQDLAATTFELNA